MPWLYLLLTILVESPVHALALRREPLWQVVLACVLMNGLTHPLANFAVLDMHWNYWLVEGMVMAVETALVLAIWRRAWWLAPLANALSAALGLVL